MPFFIRLLVNAVALWVATRVVPGVTFNGGVVPMLGVALVFGIVNATIGFITKIVAIPLILVTLGFFILVVNGMMLLVTSAFSSALGLGFHVRGFPAAFWGALVVSVVSTLLSIFVSEG
jgi:putative membrane protein